MAQDTSTDRSAPSANSKRILSDSDLGLGGAQVVLKPPSATKILSDAELGFEAPSRSVGDYVRDGAAWAVKGAIGVPEAVVGLADIPTGGAVGRLLENKGGSVGFRPKEAKEIVNDWHSDAFKANQTKFQEADGIVEKAKVAIQNPSLIVGGIAESLPSMGTGAVLARGAMAATRLGQMGAKGAAIAGAAGEGLTMAGAQAEAIRQETDDGLLTAGQAGAALATGALGAGFGLVGNKLAGKLGVGDVDTMVAQGAKGMAKQAADEAATAAANPLMTQAAKSLPRQVIEGALVEGVFEELPQSMTETIIKNLALDKPWSEGLDEAIVMGVLSGGAMGGAAAGYKGFTAPKPAKDAEGAPAPAGQANTQEQQAKARKAAALQRVQQAWQQQAQLLAEQEAGEAEVPQTAPPDGAAALAVQQQREAAARQAVMEAGRQEMGPDDEILQSTGMAPATPSQQMGIDPAAGPMSTVAAAAVDGAAARLASTPQYIDPADDPSAGIDTTEMIADPVQEAADPYAEYLVDYDALSPLEQQIYDWEVSQRDAPEEARLALADLDDSDVPLFDQASNVSEEDFLRALGATDEEIADALKTPNQPAGAQRHVEGPAAAQANDATGARQGAGGDQGQIQAPGEASASVAPAANKGERIAQLEAEADAFEAQARDWASREYKPNSKPLPEQAAKGGPADVGEANEQRRLKKILDAKVQGAQAKDEAQALMEQGNAQAQMAGKQRPKKGAVEIAQEGNAQREADRQRGLQASERWMRMTVAERQDAAKQAKGLNAVARANAPKRAWADLTEKMRGALLDVVAPAATENKATGADETKAPEQNKPETIEVPAPTAPKHVAVVGKDIDAEWAEFSKESGTKGIPRAQMPQIKAVHRGAMTNFMNARGVAHEEQEAAADTLKPTQAEFSKEKVARAKEAPVTDRSVLVSKDGYVLDGHHQWMAALEKGEQVKVLRLDADIDQLLALAHEFPSSTVAEGAAKATLERDLQEQVAIKSDALSAQNDAAAPFSKPEADAVQAPEELIPAPDGGLDYGEVTAEMGREMRRQAGKIRLRRGNEAWGMKHIEARHGEQFKSLGFQSAADYIAHVASNFNAIYKGSGAGLSIVLDTGRTGGRLMVQLEPSPDGDFYDVKTASPVRAEQYKKQKPLWQRAGTSAPTAQGSSLLPRDQNGSASVPSSAAAPQASRIADVGEKIGGARKDVWSGFKEDLRAVGDDQIKEQPLSKVWPQPDYQKLIDGGAGADVIAMVRALRDAVETKPRQSYKVSRWAGQVKVLRSFAADLLDGKVDLAAMKADIKKLSSRSLRNVLGRAELYEAVGHAKSLEGISLDEHHYSLYRGRENVHLWAVEQQAKSTAFSNWPREMATGDTKEAAIEAFKQAYAEMGAPKEKKAASFDIITEQYTPGYYVGKKLGRAYAKLAGPFPSTKAARAYRDANEEDLTKKLQAYKDVPQERADENRPRVGQDMRNGVDVTPELFRETFGFRGVEFGNWVAQGRRQQELNQAYDALMDMAAVLQLPPKALSLNGELGMAFGARGAGGVNAAKAHYEPAKVVINLTKRTGAGSLGHEWWHAVDNYFSRMRKAADGFMTSSSDVKAASNGNKYSPHGDGVRAEMIEAFGEVMRAIGSTAMPARSSKLDERRTKDYWSTDVELSARAFESYLIAKLQDQSASNDYLANVVNPKAWEKAAEGGVQLDNSYPYPSIEEMPKIRAGFDKFFMTVETKETDKGVAMFSRPQADFKRNPELSRKTMAVAQVRQIAEAVRKAWANPPDMVIAYDMQDEVIPKAVRDADLEQRSGGAEGEPDGFYYKGQVYLIASRMQTANDVVRVLSHEALGHYGLQGCFVVGDVATMRRGAQAIAVAGETSLPVALIAQPEEAWQVPPRCIPVLELPGMPAPAPWGQITDSAGAAAAACVQWAARAALRGEIAALVTAPLHKEALHAGGVAYPGHTELLQAEAAQHAGVAMREMPVRMMLANDELRTVLVSIHVSLRKALEAVTFDNILQTLQITHAALQRMLGRAPRIGVAGLNPHAGEGGLFGTEEIEIIAPAIAAARAQGIDAQGPFAPDTVFMRARNVPGHPGEFDVVLAMYHDQGLIPVKYLGVESGVNVTLGLPLVRTSPDHGTAFDIAGQGVADASSLLEAVRMVQKLSATVQG